MDGAEVEHIEQEKWEAPSCSKQINYRLHLVSVAFPVPIRPHTHTRTHNCLGARQVVCETLISPQCFKAATNFCDPN